METYTLSVYSQKQGKRLQQLLTLHGEPIGTHLGSDEPRQLKYIPEKDLLINISYSHETYNYTMSYYDGSSMNLLKSKVMDNDFYESTLGISDNGDYIYIILQEIRYINLIAQLILKEDEIDLFSLMPIGNYNYIQTVQVNNSNQLVAIIVDNNNKWRPSFFNMNTKKLVKTLKLNMGGLTASEDFGRPKISYFSLSII